jgi:hypothetical protein
VFPIFVSLSGFLFFSLISFNPFEFKMIKFWNRYINLYLIFRKAQTIISKFLSNKWYFDLVYNEFLTNNTFKWGYLISYKLIDKGLLELLGINLIFKSSLYVSNLITNLQTGLISTNIRLILISLAFIQILYF